MISVPVYNQEGKETEKLILPDEVFDVKLNSDLVHQALVAQMANSRQVLAHTKGRGEVRGGGKKPWKQKHTGRARHGSIRSPLWIGGGITFGPTKERNFKKKINKKMKRAAFLMVLSAKLKDKYLMVIEELKINQPKTKEAVQLINKLIPEKKKSVLIILPKRDLNFIKAVENIPDTKILSADSLNTYDLLRYKYLLISKEAITIIQKTYAPLEVLDEKF